MIVVVWKRERVGPGSRGNDRNSWSLRRLDVGEFESLMNGERGIRRSEKTHVAHRWCRVCDMQA
jgi:hypothetical protein